MSVPLEHAIFLSLARRRKTYGTRAGPLTLSGIKKALLSTPKKEGLKVEQPVSAQSIRNALERNPQVFCQVGGRWGIYPGLVHFRYEHFENIYPKRSVPEILEEIFNLRALNERELKKLVLDGKYDGTSDTYYMGRWPGAPKVGLAFNNQKMAENPSFLPPSSFTIYSVHEPGNETLCQRYTDRRKYGGYWISTPWASWVAEARIYGSEAERSLVISVLQSTIKFPERGPERALVDPALNRMKNGRKELLEHLIAAAKANSIPFVILSSPERYGHPSQVLYGLFSGLAKKHGYVASKQEVSNEPCFIASREGITKRPDETYIRFRF